MDAHDLHIRRVGIDTWRESVAYLHRDCEVVRATGFQALAKVQVRANGQTISAVLNVVDDERIVSACELGLSEDAFARLDVPEGHSARLPPAEPAESIPALHRKIAGERLGREDLHAIIRDVAAARYSKIELAAFVIATNGYDLDRDEVLHLTEAMIEAASRPPFTPEPALLKSTLLKRAGGLSIESPKKAGSPCRCRPSPRACPSVFSISPSHSPAAA